MNIKTNGEEKLEQELTNEEIKKIREYIENNGRKRLVKCVSWVVSSVFSAIAIYWLVEAILDYRSEPLRSTTTIIQNDTFAWPTVTIKPWATCYNHTAVDNLKTLHNINVTVKEREVVQFEVTDSNFDWLSQNVSEIYLETRYNPPLASHISECSYFSATKMLLNIYNCFNETRLGKWEIYNTQYNANAAFTPVPGSSIHDMIRISVNASMCRFFTVAIHPATDKFYGPHPINQMFEVKSGFRVSVHVAIEEFHRVSTRASPCVYYSQPECYENKVIEWKIKKAGCYLPGITGYQQLPGYPECKNASSYNRFMDWHNKLRRQPYFEDLEKMKKECGEPCITKKYIVTDKSKRPYHENFASFVMMMDTRSMNYQNVKEERAMPLDVLVGNIGGILGLFLGLSFLSLIDAIEYVISRVLKILGNK